MGFRENINGWVSIYGLVVLVICNYFFILSREMGQQNMEKVDVQIRLFGCIVVLGRVIQLICGYLVKRVEVNQIFRLLGSQRVRQFNNEIYRG